MPSVRTEIDRYLIAGRSDGERATGDGGFYNQEEAARLGEAIGIATRQAAPLGMCSEQSLGEPLREWIQLGLQRQLTLVVRVRRCGAGPTIREVKLQLSLT